MKIARVELRLEPDLRARIDAARGDVPLNRWVTRALERELLLPEIVRQGERAFEEAQRSTTGDQVTMGSSAHPENTKRMHFDFATGKAREIEESPADAGHRVVSNRASNAGTLAQEQKDAGER